MKRRRMDRTRTRLHREQSARAALVPTATAMLGAVAALMAAGSVGADSPMTATAGAHTKASMQCADLMREDFTRIPEAPTILFSAEIVPAAGDIEEYCSVKGYIQPQIQFELRLPSETWNGRYFQTGCGGTCGSVNPERCDDALAQGFVVAANNMGHASSQDGLWGLDPMLRIDYGPRSTHVMAVIGKALIEKYYGRKTAHSYFRGCSTGGREGLMEALHWPLDFDGIIAGDPAFPSRQGGIINNWIAQHLNTSEGEPVFSEPSLALLNSAVLEECDGIDGLKDGIIEDPRDCPFDVTSLQCAEGLNSSDCLSVGQVAAARQLYDGPRNSQTGQRLYPGWVVFGSERSWSPRLNINYADQFLRFMAFAENPPLSYTYRDFNFDTDVSALEQYASIYDPVAPHTDPDMGAFREAGGKLIVYHGWADATVSPLTSLDFYAEVTEREGGIESVQDWYRLFMVPGMFHCRGGGVPDQFDLLSAIVAWVEQGQAPDAIIAAQREGDNLLRTRPLYPYPAVARFSGTGDVNDAANWKSVTPTSHHDDDIKWIWDP